MMTLEASTIHSLDDDKRLSLTEFQANHAASPVHAVAAIGNPARFFTLLTKHGIDHTQHVFADHHRFQTRDFAPIPNATAIVMTEKDAVKCRELGLENAWYVPVDAALSDDFRDWFKNKLLELTRDMP
jgi:tetraacyldisaccharide 4'-kinase